MNDKYETWWVVKKWENVPFSVKVTKETEHSVFVGGLRRSKIGEYCCYVKTFEEAVGILRKRSENKIRTAEEEIREQRVVLSRLASLLESDCQESD